MSIGERYVARPNGRELSAKHICWEHWRYKCTVRAFDDGVVGEVMSLTSPVLRDLPDAAACLLKDHGQHIDITEAVMLLPARRRNVAY